MYLANGGNDIYVTVPASNAIALFSYSSNLSVSQRIQPRKVRRISGRFIRRKLGLV